MVLLYHRRGSIQSTACMGEVSVCEGVCVCVCVCVCLCLCVCVCVLGNMWMLQVLE